MRTSEGPFSHDAGHMFTAVTTMMTDVEGEKEAGADHLCPPGEDTLETG